MPFGDAGGQPPPWQQAADRLGHILGGAGASSQLSEKKRCGVQEGPGAPAALRRGDGKSGVSAKDLHRGQRGLEARLSRSKEFGGNLFSGDDRKDSSRAATAPAEAESKPEDGLAKALGSLGAASQRFVAGVAGSLPFSPGSERCKGQGREEATTTAAVHIAERRGRQPSSSHQKRASTSAVPDDLSVNVDSFMNGEAKPWDVLGELLKGRERHHSGQALVSTPQDQLPDMTTDVWRGEHLFARISDFPENVAHAMLPRGAVGAAPDQRTSNNNSSRHQVGKGRGRDSGRDVSVTGPQTQPAEVPLVSGMKGLFGRIGDISDSLGKPPAAVKEDIAPNQGLSPRAPAAAPAPSKPARQNLIGRISELSEEISKRTPRSREQPEARASTPPPGDAMAFQSPLGSAGRQQLLERISENLGMATPKTKEAGPTVTTPQNIGPGSGPSGPAQEFPDTPLRSLPPIRTSPKPPGPPDVAAVTTGVLKSIDSLYSEGVAKPVGTLIGPGVEKLQATLQQMSVKELVEGLQKLALARKGGEEGKRPVYPNRQRLSSVQDFFLYAEAEGRRLFDELDFDGDGQVTLPDLEHAMRKRRLPKHYAREMLRRARPHWLASSFGWPEFQALMEQKEPSMLKAFTSLSVSSSGTLQKGQVLASLSKAGLPATEENARAMMKFLDADGDQGQVTYGQFRNFLLLLPPERLSTADPSMLWFEASTVVPMAPPVGATAGASVLRSALAGGLASGLSTCVMHPLDTIKTRVQASSATLSEVMADVPKMGLVGVYRGATPAIVGQFASHGLRTGMFEATRMLLKRLKPELSEYQVQPVASLCSTVLGTAIRIPCEVLKQRLQAGMHPSVGAALSHTLKEDGMRGLFRGTTATLLREVPFYVFGMFIYLQVKNAAKGVLRRELAPWETLLLGGVSGGLAAVAITPFDVIKTRMMIAPKGSPSGLIDVGVDIATREGLGALYKGALPRFFWIAPLGAMNFAGYELAKQAIEEKQEP